MPKFVTIGYGDESGYKRTDPAVLAAAHASDERQQAGGAIMGIAGAPVQVRNHGGAGVQTKRGAFLSSDLPLAGFSVIEADSLTAALELAAQAPCAVAYGVVEVWPLEGA